MKPTLHIFEPPIFINIRKLKCHVFKDMWNIVNSVKQDLSKSKKGFLSKIKRKIIK